VDLADDNMVPPVKETLDVLLVASYVEVEGMKVGSLSRNAKNSYLRCFEKGSGSESALSLEVVSGSGSVSA
jgi:hypothetical protein